MNLKNVLVAFLVFSIADLILYGCYCDCDFAPTGSFEVCSVEAKALDNSGGSASIAGDTVLAEAFAIEITLNLTEEDICFHSITTNSAFAGSCNCPDAFFENRNPIIEAHIYTNNDFSPSIDAGDDISSLFYRYRGHDYEPVITRLRPVNASSTAPIKVEALLMEAPTFRGEHSFEVSLVMFDGNKVTATTSNVYLK
ncbi:MAG: DUF5034 domain-containing protein [Flavobacteriia bacterium]|nr:DUF5034 domain-containing protein [Flavobacteriia bacterium]